MEIFKKIAFLTVVTLLSLKSFANNEPNTEKSCIFNINTFTAAPITSTAPCTMYQFTCTYISQSANPQITWNFGDGSPAVVQTGPGSPIIMVHQYTVAGTYTASVNINIGCGAMTKTLVISVTCPPPCPTFTHFSHTPLQTPAGACAKFEFNLGYIGYNGPICPSSPLVVTWNWGDASPTQTTCADVGAATVHTYTTGGTFSVTVTMTGPGACSSTTTQIVTVTCPTISCIDCIPSFAPIPGKKYMISAWVKEDNPPQAKTAYTFPSLFIVYPSLSFTTTAFVPSGHIIDGWQRIEGEFLIPAAATNMAIKLNCSSGDCFFDDIRVFPFDGSMKSYVYDPKNMRLTAELDERNYATLYEYDDEGKLIRVKKETEKGKMTIQENRNNTKK